MVTLKTRFQLIEKFRNFQLEPRLRPANNLFHLLHPLEPGWYNRTAERNASFVSKQHLRRNHPNPSRRTPATTSRLPPNVLGDTLRRWSRCLHLPQSHHETKKLSRRIFWKTWMFIGDSLQNLFKSTINLRSRCQASKLLRKKAKVGLRIASFDAFQRVVERQWPRVSNVISYTLCLNESNTHKIYSTFS